MIDSIKVAFLISKEQRQILETGSFESQRIDRTTNKLLWRFFNGSFKTNSWNRECRYWFDDYKSTKVYFEFSVPKVFYGHNIYLVNFYQFLQTLQYIENILTSKIGKIPPFKTWQVLRLDLCYNWKLPKQEDVQKVIDVLRNYHFPKLLDQQHIDSIYERSKTSGTVIKFYNKHNEVRAPKHDISQLLYEKLDVPAGDIYNLSKGVLRFEVQLRSISLKRNFNKKIIQVKDLNAKNIMKILQKYFYKKTKRRTELNTPLEVWNKLNSVYKMRTAEILYNFWENFHSEDQQKQQIIASIKKSTFYYRMALLEKAQIGIFNPYSIPHFQFSIPSTDVIRPSRRKAVRADMLPVLTG